MRRNGVAFLPDYDAVILDEAHMLEMVAGDHFGGEVGVGVEKFRAGQRFGGKHKTGMNRENRQDDQIV